MTGSFFCADAAPRDGDAIDDDVISRDDVGRDAIAASRRHR